MEIELKFQVPRAHRAALRRAVATAGARVTRLQAIYADTPDARLAAAGLALRLRKEGRLWMQTLKGRGDGVSQRLEHEVPVAPVSPAEPPVLDPARHAGSAAGDALAAALHGAGDLAEVFRTDVRRTHRRVRHGGAVVEVALDEGRLVAGARRAEVCEIEFELIAGPPAALPALAARWAQRHGLWWDVRSKAERGHRLALGEARTPPVKARAAPLDAGGGTAPAFATMVLACLAHALPNAAEVADGRGDPEHLHQLRVGLRRLRSVLREAADWSGDATAARALEADWREAFARLGAVRDADAVAAALGPRLEALGAPPLAAALVAGDEADTARSAGAADAAGTAGIVRDPALQALLLRSLALVAAAGPASASLALPEAAAALLRRAWRRALEGHRQFESAPAAEQHRTRKRLKRLRYLFEFLMPLYPPKSARRMQRALAAVGEALGELNDLYVASAAYEAMTAHEPRAWLALGWLAAQRELAVRAAARRLRKLSATPRPWR